MDHAKRAAEECTDISRCRTVDNVFWSSLAVTFACVWHSMHPNVPAQPDELARKFKIRQFELMVLALVAPELVVARAYSERHDARELSKNFGLSVTHMHFLLMGGFVDCSKRLPIIETDLGNQGILREIGSVKKRDINDHTKSDALSKTVTALQTVWFVVQCIARTGMGFALSEIELSALSFAIIHFLTYIFWWEKPRGVERAIVLPVDCSNGPTAYSMWSSTTSESCRGQRQINIDINDPHAINQQLDHLQHRSRTDRLTAARKYLPSLLQWILGQYEILLGIDPPNAPVRILLQHIPALGMIIEAADVQPHTRPFNVRLWSEQPRQIAQHKSAVNIPTIVVGFIVGLIFGGVHLLGWNLYFPTRAEKVIWRVCSLVLIFAPPLFVIYPKGDPDEVIGKPILARLKYYVCKGFSFSSRFASYSFADGALGNIDTPLLK